MTLYDFGRLYVFFMNLLNFVWACMTLTLNDCIQPLFNFVWPCMTLNASVGISFTNMNYFLHYLTLFTLFTLFDSILFFFALFDSVLLSFTKWFYSITFELDWQCQSLFWLFNMFDSYYPILFNYLWIGLNTFISVWLCLTHAVMHKFCACYLTTETKPQVTSTRLNATRVELRHSRP